MRNKKTIRAVALLLCVCCLCPFLLGMTATAGTLGDSGQREDCLITCYCTVRCSENVKNPDCPGCQENLTVCIGKPFSCVCAEICTEEKRNEACPACVLAIWPCTGKEPEPVCSCEVKCAADAGKADCPVCAADPAGCAGKEPEPAPVCSCEVKCPADVGKADCPVCAADPAGCAGKEPEPVPVCSCSVKCKAGAVATACPICKNDLTACKGKEATPAPAPAGSYSINIVAPSGWHTKTAKVEIRVADDNGTGWKKVEAKIERNGSPEDLTDAFAGGGRVYVTISENCTVYVTVTDQDGKATTKSRYIECFDRTAPTVKTGISGRMLRVEASDELSGVEAIYIDGERFTDLTNGSLDVPLRDLGDDYDQFSIQAVDEAGNKSKTAQVKNPNYKAPATNKNEDKPTTSPAPCPTPTPAPTPAPEMSTPTVSGSTAKPTGGGTSKPTGGSSGSVGGGSSTVKPSEPTEPGEEKEPNPFTPEGSGEVVDNATDGDGKEFFTITTADESVFYLVIDRQRGTENVYFLNAVTIADLEVLAVKGGEEIPGTVAPAPAPEPTPELEPEPTPEPEPAPEPEQKPNAAPLLLGLAVLLIGGGAGWYFKIYRTKHAPEPEPEEDYDESDPYADGDPWDEDGENGDSEEPEQ